MEVNPGYNESFQVSRTRQASQNGGQPTRKRRRSPSSRGDIVLRTAIACRACRDRKTRCSGDQPSCTYCAKAGLECQYLENGAVKIIQGPSSSNVEDVKSAIDDWGSKILSGMSELAQNVERSSAANVRSTHPATRSNLDLIAASDASRGPRGLVGLRSVLSWDVFSTAQVPSISSLSESNVLPLDSTPGTASATTDQVLLEDLAREFEATYGTELPFLEMDETNSCIREVVEDGPSWSSRSCFIFLIAALMWDSRRLSDPHNMASRYWNMARKRLSWVIESADTLSIKCLCLTAIWYFRTYDLRNATKMMKMVLCSLAADHRIVRDESRKAKLQEIHAISFILASNISIADQSAANNSDSELDLFVSQSLKLLTVVQSTSSNAVVSIRLSLLQIRHFVIDACREIDLESSWSTIGDVLAKISDLQDCLEDWRKYAQGLLPSLFTENDSINTLQTLECATSLLKDEYLSVVELLHRPWLYIWVHGRDMQGSTDAWTRFSANHAFKSALVAKSLDMVKIHQGAVLACLNFGLSLLKDQSSPLIWNPEVESTQIFEYALLLLSTGLRSSPLEEPMDNAECQAAIEAVCIMFKADNATARQKGYSTILSNLRKFPHSSP